MAKNSTTKEYYLLWKYCRDNDLVTEYTPIQFQGLAWYAVEHDFCDPDEREQFQTGDDDGDKKANRNLKPPDEAYILVLKDIEEKTGQHPGQLAGNKSGTDSDARNAAGSQGGNGNPSPGVDADQLARDHAIKKFGVNVPDPDEKGIPYFKRFLNLHATSESPDEADDDSDVFVTASDL